MTESQHQMQVIKWSQQAHIRQAYPELKLLYHIPNERKCSQITGRLLKLMGLKKGVPDLHLPVPRGKWHGLYIEMKTEKGKTSEAQDWWLLELQKQGYCCAVCHGWQDAVDVLEAYLCVNMKLSLPQQAKEIL